MTPPIAIIGAPSSIGIRPYDEGGSRRLDLAPDRTGAARRAELVEGVLAGDALSTRPCEAVGDARPGGRP